MKLSENGSKLLVEWEGGFQLKPYLDSGGLETIGCGHLLTADELESGQCCGEEYANGLSEDACWKLFAQDVAWAEKAVDEGVTVVLNQNQFDALVSFVFNVGSGAFKSSTLLRVLNMGQYEQVPSELRRWNKVAGEVVQGLVNRREKEIGLWDYE